MTALEDQIREQGIHYPTGYDVAYKTGFAIQTLGMSLFAVLYLLQIPFYVWALLVFEAGVALSSFYLLVWNRNIKKFILGCLFMGILFQLIGAFMPFGASEVLHEKFFVIGLAFILVAASGLYGKEAYCFRFNEGWVILLLYPLWVLPNIFATPVRYNIVIGFVLSALHFSFLRKKLAQPLLRGCDVKGCEPPPPATGDKP
jgi:uncharacterized integral membrane protein